VGDNGPIDATLKVLSDGLGTNLPMEVSTTGVNLTGSPTVNAVAIANTTQVAAKQDTLVSGTNIKTINGTSLLGSGNIPVVTSPSGVAGAIQFSNGSAFASDAANLFWDDTNDRLGIGTNAPTQSIHTTGNARIGNTIIRSDAMLCGTGSGSSFTIFGDQTNFRPTMTFYPVGNNINIQGLFGVGIGGATTIPSATAHFKGSGSTSATTSLLVQNSAGTQGLKIDDALGFQIGSLAAAGAGTSIRTDSGGGGVNAGINTNFNNGATWIDDTNTRAMQISYNGGVLFANTTRYPITIGSATKAVASAQLEMVSTTQGFLPPRMTTTQKNAIASPAAGLVVYDSTTNKLCCYNGSTWNDLF
jgi:hypothetical protein